MTAESEFTGFERATAHRQALRKIIADVTAIADGLNAAGAPVLREIDERLANDAFRVMVVGDFKRGKSTLINGMLGADVLPAYALPTTAILTELRWSAQPYAELYPADDGAPVCVGVDKLSVYITIPSDGRPDAGAPSRWKLAVVGWPLDILRNGVVLIDSPGLNEHPVRQAVTLQRLRSADAVVFVQDIQHAASMDEVRFLDTYLDTYDVFFVFNKINFIAAGEADNVKNVYETQMRGRRGDGHHDRYFFVNAKAGVQARIKGDDAAWRESAVAGFVEELSEFLATERHRVKITGPAREVTREIRQLRQAVPDQLAFLDQKEADLRQRYDEAQAPLRRLGERAKLIGEQLDHAQRDLRAVVRAEVASRLTRMSSDMPEIVAAITPEAELSLAPWRARSRAESYATELSERASGEAASRFKGWQEEELKPLLEPRLTALSGQAGNLFAEFMRDLATVRRELTGAEPAAAIGLADLGQRELADTEVVATDFTGGLAVRHLMGQIATAYGVLLAWAFTPWGFASLIIGVLLANGGLVIAAKGRAERKVREELSSVLARKMREEADGNADRVAGDFGTSLGAAIGELMSRIDSELAQLRVQVEDALGKLSAGEDEVQQAREQLKEWGEVLEASADAVENLISDVART